MKRFGKHIVAALLVALGAMLVLSGCQFGGLTPTANDNDMSDARLAVHVPGQAIVRLDAGGDINAVAKSIGATVERKMLVPGAYLLNLAKGQSVTDAVRQLKAQAGVRYAQPNYIYETQEAVSPNDEMFAQYQWGPQRIGAPEAWEVTKGSENVIIAVVDTGVDWTHEDLAENGKVLVDDGFNATVDPATEPDKVHYAMDDNGHGTHVAGIAAANGNNIRGIAGLAWNSPVLPVKVLAASGSGTDQMVADGIQYVADYATAHPDKRVVLNMSLGGIGYSQVMKDAVDAALDANVVVVAAMGNSSKRGNTHYPSAFPGVIAVGATNGLDEKASFSTTGRHISVAAPGVDIWSSVPRAFTTNGYGYDNYSGTSMATPHVTGAAALVLSVHPEFTPAQVKAQLEATASDLGPAGWDELYGAGLINVAKAVGAPAAAIYGDVAVTVTQAGAAVEAANVTVVSAADASVADVLTNKDGVAIFHTIPAGTGYKVRVVFEGQVVTSDSFDVEAGKKTEVAVELP